MKTIFKKEFVIYKSIFLLILTMSLMLPFSGSGNCFGQSGRVGTLKGMIVDEFDARIVGAKVELIKNKKTRTFYSNDLGEFLIEIPHGIYLIKVTKEGFGTYINKKVLIKDNQIADLAIQLKLPRYKHRS